MRSTKHSLFTSAIALVLCFTMLLSTTFAWFTDTASTGSNVVTSGNLDIEVAYTLGDKDENGEFKWNKLDGATDLFQKGLWEPGHTEVVALKVENKGSLALKYATSLNVVSKEIGKTKDGADIDLSQHLTVSTLAIEDAGVDPLFNMNIAEETVNKAFEDETAIAWGTASAITTATALNLDMQLLPAKTNYVFVKVDMPETVGNEANHNGVNVPDIKFGLNVVAAQLPHEKDSFGKDYDANATYPNVTTSGTQSKMLEEGASFIDFEILQNGKTIGNVRVPADAIADTSQPVTVTFVSINPTDTVLVDENTKAYSYDINVTNLKDTLSEDQMVTVKASVPKALAAMNAYHNGELMADAVYDEVEGTITFKTASFSPYDFTTQIENVSTLEQLRAALQKEGTTAKLTADITVDLTKDSGEARDKKHAYVGSNATYYNGVMVEGKNVGLDLNGHNITAFCGDAYNSNSDVGALFFVGKEGSLNITNTGAVSTGFIKMESSIYAVWAPFADPSYVDIYGGAFIADSYAGDPIGTSTNPGSADGTMQNENSNRALIYAGFGGNMNVYGGYFLYNNTPNDVKNRNNGAFNAKDFYEESTPLLTIHEGVMLINKEYRQNPANTSQPNGSYDNYSVKLAKDCEIGEVSLVKAVTIDGKSYSNWYQVIRGITSISASAKQTVYEAGHNFTADDFNVYAFSSNGTAGKITNFTVSMNGTTATITYTSSDGTTLTTNCTVAMMNLTILDETEGSRIKAPGVVNTGSAYRPTYTGVGYIGTGNFDVSGWANVVQSDDTKHYDYYANGNRTYIAPNGEKVTGFNNTISVTGNGNNRKASYDAGYYDLTVENALPYTTLGINCVVGCLEDVPKLMGFGCYINNDPTTLKWNAPAKVYSDPNDGMYQHYGWNNGHSLFSIDCSNFEPGKTYTVQWVLVFEDGLSKLSEWTVKMKAADETTNDKMFVDTEKPNANVIIMAGQSNMFGPAPITQSIRDQYANVDYSDVYIHYANINFNEQWNLQTYFSNSDFEQYKLGIGAQGNTYFGPEAAVAKGLATSHPGEKWFIIKYAAAGTALTSQWNSNCIVDGKTTTLTNDMLDYVQNAIDGLSEEYDVHIRSFMWMQGESDAGTKDAAQKYAAAEKNLVSTVRNEFAAYATRPVGSVPGSGISYVNAGIAVNDTDFNTAQGGPNDWVYAEIVNAGKISNSQWLCSVPGYNAGLSGSVLTYGPLAGNSFVGTPSIPNPNQSGVIVNSIYMDTCHLLSKATAHALDPSHPLYEDYGNDSDNTDWAHYSAGSMSELGSLFSSGMDFMIQQNG